MVHELSDMLLLSSKILLQIIYPLNACLLLSLAAMLAFALNRMKLGQLLLGAGIGYVLLFSVPSFSASLRLSLERQHPPALAGTLPEVDVIIVLGGSTRSSAPPEFPYPDLTGAADRVWHAARLFHAGKAPLILTSGGRLPWSNQAFSEAHTMTQFLIDLGVPKRAVMQETKSRTTRENAVFSRALMLQNGLSTALLITSALHMPRALASFKAAGIDVIPAPIDFEITSQGNRPFDWLPSASVLTDSTRALKEYIGLTIYIWRGWAE